MSRLSPAVTVVVAVKVRPLDPVLLDWVLLPGVKAKPVGAPLAPVQTWAACDACPR